MGEQITRRRLSAGNPSPFNWLKWLDREVRNFPNAANWLQHRPFQFARCRLFMMARYPQLQRPFADEVLRGEFSRGERKISEHPEARHAQDGLNREQRKELAALFLDTDNSLKFYKAHRKSANRVHKLSGEAPSRTRMLARKLGKARRALEDLRQYAAGLDELLGLAYGSAAEDCLERLRVQKEGPGLEYYRSLKAEYPVLENPLTLGMVQLYSFFRHGCGLSGDEAEVRVARIRNALWTDYGVPKVDFRPNYQTAESKGCDAVHVAVLRFKQGTSRQRTP